MAYIWLKLIPTAVVATVELVQELEELDSSRLHTCRDQLSVWFCGFADVKYLRDKIQLSAYCWGTSKRQLLKAEIRKKDCLCFLIDKKGTTMFEMKYAACSHKIVREEPKRIRVSSTKMKVATSCSCTVCEGHWYENNYETDLCHHKNVKKLRYLGPSASNGIHGPYYEVWLIKCEDCGAELEEVYPAD
jgi:hypothetical protein